jgi:hypothetical protein
MSAFPKVLLSLSSSQGELFSQESLIFGNKSHLYSKGELFSLESLKNEFITLAEMRSFHPAKASSLAKNLPVLFINVTSGNGELLSLESFKNEFIT